MTDYISRESVLQILSGKNAAWDAYQKVQSLPAADVREVVTCGECKHWFENGTDYCSCDRDALLRRRDFFCADGEKREES